MEKIDDDAIHAIVEEQVLKAIDKQKAIDIEKACEWLEKYMESLGYIDEWCRTGEDKFKKAMDKQKAIDLETIDNFCENNWALFKSRRKMLVFKEWLKNAIK